MDPITVSIVSALAAGAAAGSKDFATAAIKDSYAALKSFIVGRFKRAAPFVESLESDPQSPAQQEVLAKNLAEAAGSDEGKKLADALLQALDQVKDEPGARALLDFDTLRALRRFELNDIHLAGPLLRARDATFEGDFIATNIRQDLPETDGAKKK
jgi:hypothetical protein